MRDCTASLRERFLLCVQLRFTGADSRALPASQPEVSRFPPVDPEAKDQNSNRAPNWKYRGACPVALPSIVPKNGFGELALPTPEFGWPKRGWLRKLKISARRSIFMPSLTTNDL